MPPDSPLSLGPSIGLLPQSTAGKRPAVLAKLRAAEALKAVLARSALLRRPRRWRAARGRGTWRRWRSVRRFERPNYVLEQ
jgi:hypothetical protein